jgi:hypothetical protein
MDHIVRIVVQSVAKRECVIKVMDTVWMDANLDFLEINVIHAYLDCTVNIAN